LSNDALEATSVDREMLVNVNCPIKMILNYFCNEIDIYC